MATRRQLVFVLAGVIASLGASHYRTTNFYVEAPTLPLAQQFGQAAEQYRRQKALEWLGQEMPPWPEPCPLKIKVTMGSAGGATSFAFDGGRVLGQHMTIEGSLDRLLVSVLPHEVTHTVFAYYFRCPVPRWADEGGAVLSEDDIERDRHDKLCRQILNTSHRAIPLRRLFSLRDYPGDVMALYAQGYSVSQFLVNAAGRPTFLAFVAYGMSQGWDNAVRAYYRYNSVEELEEAWLAHLRATKRPPALLAQNPAPTPAATPTQRLLVRQTLPPAQPVLAPPAPIVRGRSDEQERLDTPSRLTAVGRPGYLPDLLPDQQPSSASVPDTAAASRDGWQPAPSSVSAPSLGGDTEGGYRPPTVKLGLPQPVPLPRPELGRPTPGPISPVGYPN